MAQTVSLYLEECKIHARACAINILDTPATNFVDEYAVPMYAGPLDEENS